MGAAVTNANRAALESEASPPCSVGVCTQVDWAQHWASVFEPYNFSGPKYTTLVDKANNVRTPDGLNEIVRHGTYAFEPTRSSRAWQ
jgi:hypothetical protein